MSGNVQSVQSAYLLGFLPEDEANMFDELAFTDEHFADTLKSAESDLIDSYLHDELADATLEKFESFYLASAHRREKVEFARALQTFAEKEIVASAVVTETAEKVSFWSFLKNPQRLLQIGFAAAALLIVAFGIFWLLNLQSGKNEIEQAQKTTPTPETAALPNQTGERNDNIEPTPSATNPENKKPSPETGKSAGGNTKRDSTPEKEKPTATPRQPIFASFVLAPPLRGATKLPAFSVPKNAEKINARLQLEADDYDSYQVTLTTEAGSTNLWRNGSLKASGKGANKFLNLVFPAKLLGNGIYTLTVSGSGENGETEIIASYPFRVGIN